MKRQLLLLGIAIIIGLSGCGNSTGNEKNPTSNNEPKQEDMQMEMNHSGSGEVPENLKVAENPTYKVGSEAIIKTDHMEGMEGAVATIVGAYDTIAYAISYTPLTGGERVENHKWVIQDEIKDAGDKTMETGTEVTVEADHMKGMKGATAVIDSSEKTTVYMIDYTPTTGGEEVKNHKWVTESELSVK
ncbi:YdhK family protein [Sporosarcina sp. Marseille-Q4063]|uniref:YdhK family protein n=1 Tax=Sporosarcina sp. Marseille-Q4063 TaxID=2810514 RepID=UPI001BAF524D|nr:YdhK family protein [Sporosarcina sp. Marseille-Q4063]QUW23350.1 YdhK family protein [Sporosarcina sp. Marseille-Q4063]